MCSKSETKGKTQKFHLTAFWLVKALLRMDTRKQKKQLYEPVLVLVLAAKGEVKSKEKTVK